MAKKNSKGAKNNVVIGDAVTKTIFAFCAAALLIFIFMLISDNYSVAESFLSVREGVRLGAIISAAGAVLGLIAALIGKFAMKNPAVTTVGSIVLVVGAIMSVGLLAMYLYYVKVSQLIYFAIAAIALLYMIYNIYQKPFFFISTLCFVSAFGFYILSRMASYSSNSLIYFAVVGVMAVCIIAVAAVAAVAKGNKGDIFGVRVIDAPLSYVLMYTTSGFFTATLIASVLLGASACYACLFISIAYFFIMAIYYTIKLM